jgi:hypothetical protein
VQYRSYGELTGIPHVVVDGSAQAGTVLTLSHWPGSVTPEPLRADLSAEIAFRYLDHPELHVDVEWVTNNHFDQDGLVGVFALADPTTASPLRDRLEDVARAGDFSRFHDRDAARAAITLAGLGAEADGDPYEAVLPVVVDVVTDVDRFRTWWVDEDAHITETEAAIASGAIAVIEDRDLDLAVVQVPHDWAERTVHRFTTTAAGVAHPDAIHNATDRFAVLTVGNGAPELRYRYETWVLYRSRRPRRRVDLTGLAEDLTDDERSGGTWSFDGVHALSPALHLVGAATSSIADDEIVARVVDALRTARSTWSPFD